MHYAIIETAPDREWSEVRTQRAEVLWVRRRLPATVWYFERQLTPAVTALTLSVGIRHIGFGFGLAADPEPDSTWLRAGITVDIVDVLAPVLIRDDVPKTNLITGAVGASAYAVKGFVLARRR